MKAGLILIGVGLVLFFYAYLNYKQEAHKRADVKKQDLVDYYLDLAYCLLPGKLCCGLIGAVLVIAGIIVTLVNLL